MSLYINLYCLDLECPEFKTGEGYKQFLLAILWYDHLLQEMFSKTKLYIDEITTIKKITKYGTFLNIYSTKIWIIVNEICKKKILPNSKLRHSVFIGVVVNPTKHSTYFMLILIILPHSYESGFSILSLVTYDLYGYLPTYQHK